MGPLLALAAAGTALEVAGKFKSASAQRRAADNKATALKLAAQKRLEKGSQQSQQSLLQGEVNKTSFASSFLTRGGSREMLAQDISLDEITKRAKFESDQAMQDARMEADAILSDASDIVAQSREAQKTATYSSIGSILSLGAQYQQGKSGKDAASASKLW